MKTLLDGHANTSVGRARSQPLSHLPAALEPDEASQTEREYLHDATPKDFNSNKMKHFPDHTSIGRRRGLSSPIIIKGNGGHSKEQSKRSPPLETIKRINLREWCSGQPPTPSFLGSFPDSPPRGHLSRRSTLADRPELDHLLAAIMVLYKGDSHLPLTDSTIHRLSPFWKGAKPIADLTIFNRILVNKDINLVHADHVIATLKCIGIHCKHLVIVAPIHTSDYGDVFNREADNINSGNDWDKILAYFPYLETITFEHPDNEPNELTRPTFTNFHNALTAANMGHLKSINFSVTPQVMRHLHEDLGNHNPGPESSEMS